MINTEKQKTLVIGHRNPDTDSICSAIAYADIKNRTTQNKKYIPKRAGQINEETRYVLNRFGVQPPAYLGNIGTQVKDMDIRTSPQADKNMSLKNTWDLMQENGIVSLPIRDKDGCLEGLVTIGDIAKTYMDTTDSYLLSSRTATPCRDKTLPAISLSTAGYEPGVLLPRRDKPCLLYTSTSPRDA